MTLSFAEQAVLKGESSFRGHKIIRRNDRWVYEDDGEPLPCDGGKLRPCKKCGSWMWGGDGYVDECLGVLPGVRNACCGHGDPDTSYMVFNDGVVIRGFSIVEGHKPNEELKAAAANYYNAINSGELVDNTEPFLTPKR